MEIHERHQTVGCSWLDILDLGAVALIKQKHESQSHFFCQLSFGGMDKGYFCLQIYPVYEILNKLHCKKVVGRWSISRWLIGGWQVVSRWSVGGWLVVGRWSVGGW